jgi:E3 ubiquitin-protein ligase listerin
MNKKFKSQASSSRAASSTFGVASLSLGSQAAAFRTTSTPLSYVTELPDFSAITDPRITVAFKSLIKKDSVTKTRALEDLRDIFSSKADAGGPESSVLEAWVGVFRKTHMSEVN